MHQDDAEAKPQDDTASVAYSDEPPWWVYLIGFVAGTAVAFAVSLRWLPATTSAAVAALGGIGALTGVFVLSNIGEAVIGSLTPLTLLSLFASLGHHPFWFTGIVAPLVIGNCVGRVTGAIWKG